MIRQQSYRSNNSHKIIYKFYNNNQTFIKQDLSENKTES